MRELLGKFRAPHGMRCKGNPKGHVLVLRTPTPASIDCVSATCLITAIQTTILMVTVDVPCLLSDRDARWPDNSRVHDSVIPHGRLAMKVAGSRCRI